jgi:hypothetical protein
MRNHCCRYQLQFHAQILSEALCHRCLDLVPPVLCL